MILFVCHGNVARSQFAAALSRKRGQADVLSAGTNVRPEQEGTLLKDGGPTARRAIDCFKALTGIDIGVERRKKVTEDMAERADKIVVLTDALHLPEFMPAHRHKIEYWPIDDPHDFDFEGYKRVINEIETRLDAL
jgi:protein-tyrosine-phosphatase